MTAQQLKNSILQMAVQGKLVPQDPSDEPASVLLERIQKEKTQLIKEGKIKHKKNSLPVIIKEKIPYELPDTWVWCRLGDIISVSSGLNLPKHKMEKGDVPVFGGNGITGYHSVWNRDKQTIVIGRVGYHCGSIHLTPNKSWITDNAFITYYNEKNLNREYLIWLLKYTNLQQNISATAQPVISGTKIYPLLVPLPPLAEQHRIVQKIEETLPSIDEYGDKESSLRELNKSFPDSLKKSILQWAVQGKLVPQDPADEPASVLLERIRKEKEQLIKEGKIKKPKQESIIYRIDGSFFEKIGTAERCIDDEIPFDIPDSWEWVRLDSVCKYIQRGKSPKYSPIKKYPVIAQKCNQWSGFSIEKAQFIDPPSLSSYSPERILQDDDLMWNSTGLGTLGRIVMYKTDLNPYELAIADSHVTVIRLLKNYVAPNFLYYYFLNPSVQNIVEKLSSGTTKQKELATATVKTYLTPLPPLNEQQRIVVKIEELTPLIKSM